MNVVRRICFEITFMVLLTILMPFHFLQAIFLLIIEVAKVYPPTIYNMCVRLYYGNQEDDS